MQYQIYYNSLIERFNYWEKSYHCVKIEAINSLEAVNQIVKRWKRNNINIKQITLTDFSSIAENGVAKAYRLKRII